jgi:putative ABC transport system substrate-binding protein
LALLGVAGLISFQALAQENRVIGILGATAPEERLLAVQAFRDALKEFGYVEGQNVVLEYRWAYGHYEKFSTLAAELVSMRVAVIVAPTLSAAFAAKAATHLIPIVFASGGDPVAFGLVESLSYPGGNLTGVSQVAQALGPKRLQIIRELKSNSETVGILINPDARSTPFEELKEAAESLRVHIRFLPARNEGELEDAFATLVSERIDALIIPPDPFYVSHTMQLSTLAKRHSVAAVYPYAEDVEAGGLISYGNSIPELYHQLGVYAARILMGEKPENLPVVQPTKMELVIDLKTARELGLEIPASVLARADRLIE